MWACFSDGHLWKQFPAPPWGPPQGADGVLPRCWWSWAAGGKPRTLPQAEREWLLCYACPPLRPHWPWCIHGWLSLLFLSKRKLLPKPKEAAQHLTGTTAVALTMNQPPHPHRHKPNTLTVKPNSHHQQTIHLPGKRQAHFNPTDCSLKGEKENNCFNASHWTSVQLWSSIIFYYFINISIFGIFLYLISFYKSQYYRFKTLYFLTVFIIFPCPLEKEEGVFTQPSGNHGSRKKILLIKRSVETILLLCEPCM